MPTNPSFRARLAEWRTVLEALRYYEKHLSSTVPAMKDGDEMLVQYDHLERLHGIIPNFEHQLKELEDDLARNV